MELILGTGMRQYMAAYRQTRQITSRKKAQTRHKNIVIDLQPIGVARAQQTRLSVLQMQSYSIIRTKTTSTISKTKQWAL